LLQGICVVCGTKKSKFISASTSGKGFLNKAINSLPFEMHLPGVEFVVSPQHETSYDPETTTKEDFDHLI